ncbi:MAG: IS1182 family transposase, partial [Planctomycetota bacterium]|nr:IS1182 family transposase [Planctomycetota bacterium]
KTRGFYGHNGHLSVDPVVIVKMLLLAYLYNVPSIRELMRQTADRLSFRWFIGYDLDEKIPDHSVISKALRRFGPDVFRELFEKSVAQCAAAGLVGGELVHVDATTVKADASGDSIVERFQPAHSPERFVQAVEQEISANETKETPPSGGSAVNDRYVSTTDGDASIVSRHGGKRELAYKDHRVVDDQCGVILETQVTPAAVAEGTRLPFLIEAVHARQLYPRAVAADKSYGHAANFRYLWEQRITAHLARIRSPRQKPGVFGKEQFTYLPEDDVYLCPTGQRLSPGTRKARRGFREYKAAQTACQPCPRREACLTGHSARTIQRATDEAYVERIRPGPIGRRGAMRRRKAVMEGSFADAKERYGHRRSRWRGLNKMQMQSYLVAAVQNLGKLLKFGPKPAAEARQFSRPMIAPPTIRAEIGFVLFWLKSRVTISRSLPLLTP